MRGSKSRARLCYAFTLLITLLPLWLLFTGHEDLIEGAWQNMFKNELLSHPQQLNVLLRAPRSNVSSKQHKTMAQRPLKQVSDMANYRACRARLSPSSMVGSGQPGLYGPVQVPLHGGEEAILTAEYPTIGQQVGNTPLVRLQRLPGRTSNRVLAKLEGNNPAGSVKDRCAIPSAPTPTLDLCLDAEVSGQIIQRQLQASLLAKRFGLDTRR